MKRKLQRLRKSGIPAEFKLKCGSTLLIKKPYAGEDAYIVTVSDQCAFASVRSDSLPVIGQGDWKPLVHIMVTDDGLASLSKILAAFVEVCK